MRRLTTVLALTLLLAGAGIGFWSCQFFSKSPTEPEKSQSSGNPTIFSTETSTIDSPDIKICEINGAGYAVSTDKDCGNLDLSDATPVNPHFTHYLILMKNDVERGRIKFKKDNMRIPYLNKIQTLIKLLDKGLLQATHGKLVDLWLHTSTDKWFVEEIQAKLYRVFLEATKWMIDHPYEPLYIIRPIYLTRYVGDFKCSSTCVYLGEDFGWSCSSWDCAMY